MLFSRFTPIGLFALSNEKPLAESMYDDSVAALNGQYSLEEDDHMEGVLFANAITGALAAEFIRRGQAQRYASDVSHHLPQREDEYGLLPSPTATLLDRRNAFAVRKRRPQTWTEGEITSALQSLLGSDFVAFRPCPLAEAVVWPTNLGDPEMNLAVESVERKIIALTEPVSVGLGSPISVEYDVISVPQSASAQTIVTDVTVGDKLVFDVGNSSICETVEVTAVTAQSGLIPKQFTAVFNKPHSSGTYGFTNPFPWWTSTLRHAMVIVTAAAAQDPEKRRIIDDFMQRAVRSTSRWDIAAENGATTLQFELDAPSLGFTSLDPVTI